MNFIDSKIGEASQVAANIYGCNGDHVGDVVIGGK